MQVCFYFSFSLKYYKFIKPWYSWVVSQIPANRCRTGTCHCITLARKGRVYQDTHTSRPERLCRAVRAVAVVTTSHTTRTMCRNVCPQQTSILETRYFQLPSRPLNVNGQFVRSTCPLMLSSLKFLVYSKLQRVF